jgi:Caspase domain
MTSSGNIDGRKTALCIGVDAYPAPDTLQGCVNDSRVWEEMFRELGCSVSVLRDFDATRAAITDALAQHVAAMKAGDICLIQYAGHGVQFPDDSGDEPDNKDEALCPVDMMTAGYIRDDEVRAILNRIPAGARVFCFFDCCHSSSIARMARELGQDHGSRIRALTPTPEMILVHQQTRTAGRVATPAVRRDVVFAACRDDQVAFESAGHGDYTTRAVPIIRQHGKGLTNIAVQQLIQAEFGSGARQNPTLDCTAIDETQPFLLP